MRGITQAVETVEKVPFRKLIFGKWDKNIEKRLVFCVPNNILAIFEPVVGDFCEDFSSKEFFDSLVGLILQMTYFRYLGQADNKHKCIPVHLTSPRLSRRQGRVSCLLLH